LHSADVCDQKDTEIGALRPWMDEKLRNMRVSHKNVSEAHWPTYHHIRMSIATQTSELYECTLLSSLLVLDAEVS